MRRDHDHQQHKNEILRPCPLTPLPKQNFCHKVLPRLIRTQGPQMLAPEHIQDPHSIHVYEGNRVCEASPGYKMVQKRRQAVEELKGAWPLG